MLNTLMANIVYWNAAKARKLKYIRINKYYEKIIEQITISCYTVNK